MELVGRSHLIARVRELAVSASQGCGCLVLVSGESGMGKTSLATTALTDAPLRTVYAAASQFATPPLGPVAATLRVLGRELPADSPDQTALSQAIVALVSEASRSEPLALILDDLHWADHATLRLLPLLADAAKQATLLVLALYSTDAVLRGHPLRTVRDALRRGHKVAEIVVEPLGEAEACAIGERCLGRPMDPGIARRLLAASGGSPFFIEALARSLGDRAVFAEGDALALPEALRDAVLARFDSLSVAARSAADIAAVLGTEFDLALVASLAGGDPAVGELLDSALVLEGANGVGRFRPALLREVLYGALGWTRRRALHRAVAEVLEQGRFDPAAEHWQAAGEGLRARRAHLEAAARSRRLHAHNDVVQHLQRALDFWPSDQDSPERLAALDQLGDAAQLAGRTADALRAWREISESAIAHSPLAAARALRKIANLYELNADWARCLDAREQAQAAFAAAAEYGEAAVEDLLASNRLRQDSQLAAGLEVLIRAAAHAKASGRTDLQVRVAALKANLEVRLGHVNQIPAIRAALEAALGLEQPLLAGEIYQRLADAIERSGDYQSATAVNREGIAFCEQRKAAPGILACLTCMSWILIRSGEWEHAAVASRRMAEEFHAHPVGRGAGLGHLGVVHALRGELRKAEPLLLEGLAVGRRIGHSLLETTCLWGLGLQAAARQDHLAAAERCRVILQRVRHHDERHAVMPLVRWSASCFARIEDRPALLACADLLKETAARFSGAEPLSALAHTLGEIALLDHDAALAADQFERGLALLTDLQLPRERAETALRAAAACEALGRRDAAAAHACEAARVAERLGARPLEQAAAEQLRRLGEALSEALGQRAGRRNEQAGLTVRQLQILGAISRGLTDKEVARKLSLSPRTVESHVAKALSTLDCRSRSEAVRKATELGLLKTVAAS